RFNPPDLGFAAKKSGTIVNSCDRQGRYWMRTQLKAADRDLQDREGHLALKPKYLESLHLIERLHRRLLDVIKDEFERAGEPAINSVQALLLVNIGDHELTAGELRSRGYYHGSNGPHNLKNLVQARYVSHHTPS